MKIKKKLFVAALATTSVFTLAACSEDTVTTYDVEFNTGDKGSYVATQKINEGEKVTKPANPTHSDGNGFVEWTYEGKAYDFNTEVSKNMTLNATWATASFTVTFTTGYESDGLTVASQSVGENGKAVAPTDASLPFRAGYEISGWTLNGAPYDFTQTVTESLSLQAVWEAVSTYTVTLDTSSIKENVDASLTTQTVNAGRTIQLPSGSLTNSSSENDILNGWMMHDNTNKTLVTFDTTEVVTEDMTLIPSWIKSFSENNYNYRTNLEDTISGDWKTDATYTEHTANPFSTDSNDLVLAIKRGPSTGSSTSNSVNKFITADREAGAQSILSFDVRTVDASESALTIKIYGNNSTSSNAEVARLKINGTSSTGGGANVQWGVYNSGGWNEGAATSFSFTNTSIDTNYRIQDNQWYTVQVVFEYVTIGTGLELCAKVYLNGLHLSSSTLETNGYLTAVPSANSIFENGATSNFITGVNFSPDKQTSTAGANNIVYINNVYVETK